MSRKAVSTAALAAVGVLLAAGVATAATSEPAGSGGGRGYGNGDGSYSATVDGCRGGGSDPSDSAGGRGWGGRGAKGAGGQGKGMAGHGSAVPEAVPGAEISPEIQAVLAFMVQEEQLARDVYALGMDQYGDRVFVNINRAESSHMAAVKVLLDRYGVDDPTDAARAGEFADPALTAMYSDLKSQVLVDRAGAIEAGIAVEEADIQDLKDALELEAPADVTAVLENLLAGSERHLAAFQRNS